MLHAYQVICTRNENKWTLAPLNVHERYPYPLVCFRSFVYVFIIPHVLPVGTPQRSGGLLWILCLILGLCCI